MDLTPKNYVCVKTVIEDTVVPAIRSMSSVIEQAAASCISQAIAGFDAVMESHRAMLSTVIQIAQEANRHE